MGLVHGYSRAYAGFCFLPVGIRLKRKTGVLGPLNGAERRSLNSRGYRQNPKPCDQVFISIKKTMSAAIRGKDGVATQLP